MTSQYRAEKKIQSYFKSTEPRKLSCQKLNQVNLSKSESESTNAENTTSSTMGTHDSHESSAAGIMRAKHLERGKFVGILDMTNVTLFSSRPSIRVVINAVELIKYAYPNRLDSLYVVNAGYIFSTIWKLIHPTLSETSIGKIYFISSIEEARRILPVELGKEGLEVEYGGDLVETFRSAHYFQTTGGCEEEGGDNCAWADPLFALQ
jgi:hypothetical protein